MHLIIIKCQFSPRSLFVCVYAEIEKYGKVTSDLCIILFNSVVSTQNTEIIILIPCTRAVFEKGYDRLIESQVINIIKYIRCKLCRGMGYNKNLTILEMI